MKTENVRFGRTLECACGAQLEFNFNATAKIDNLEIDAVCPNCGAKVRVAMNSSVGGSGSGSGGSFEFSEIKDEDIQEATGESSGSSGSSSSGSSSSSSSSYSSGSSSSGMGMFDDPQ